MTLVRISLTIPGADGLTAPATGMFRFTPTARRTIIGTPDKIVLPHPFTVALVDGVANVTLEPTTALWVWQVDEYLAGVPARTVYVQVPNVTEADYPDLTSVDPATLTPGPSPHPAWVASMNLALARTPEALFSGAVTRDVNGAPTSAPVKWPDAITGTYTGTPSATFPGSIDSYTITYGSPVTKTYTQPAVTRDASGNVTTQPAITVS